MDNNFLTIDQLIFELQKVRNSAPFGGETCVAVCLDGSGVPYCLPAFVEIEKDDDGGLCVLRVPVFQHEVRLGGMK